MRITREEEEDLENKKYFMKNFFLLLLVSFLILPILVFAQTEKKKAVYFYSDTCPRCVNVEKYLVETGLYEKYDIQKLEIYSDNNFEKLNSLFEAFNIPEGERGVPVVFFDRKFLAGDIPIIENFDFAIGDTGADFFPEATLIKNISEEEGRLVNPPKKYVSDIPLSIIAGAAILEVFNPCSLAVVVLFFIFLFFSKFKKRILLFGLFFSLAVFLMHLLSAFGIYSSIKVLFLQKYFSFCVGLIAVIVGIANLKYVIWRKKGKIFENKFLYKFTIKWHAVKKVLVEKFSTPLGFFVVGIISSLFLFSCANEPYRAIISSLKEENNFIKSFGFLIFYNIIFIIPFLFCAWFLERFSKTKKFELFYDRIFNLIKIFFGVIMVFVGLYLIVTWFK